MAKEDTKLNRVPTHTRAPKATYRPWTLRFIVVKVGSDHVASATHRHEIWIVDL